MASETGRSDEAPIYGVSAAFTSPEALLDGVARLAPQHLGRIETHSPVPIPGLSELLGTASSLRPYAIIGAVLGFAAMMAMCIYATAVDYVFDIGGRPLVSWPSFVVPSVSFAMLTGALATLLGMLFANRLPRLNHPAFNIPGFTRASQDRYFLVITPSRAAPLDVPGVAAALGALPQQPVAVAEVPR